MTKSLLAAILLAGTSLHASASTIDLGSTRTDGSVEARTSFKDNTDNYLQGVNSRVFTAYSESRTSVSFGRMGTPDPETSVHTYSEADTLKGGHVGSDFYSMSKSDASLDYRFEIVGAANTQVQVAVALQGSIAVTGDFSSTGGGANAEVWLSLYGRDVNVQRDVFLQNQSYYTSPRAYSGFDASGEYLFDTNTAYDVYIRASTSAVAAVNSFQTTKSNYYATADVDPTFTLDPEYGDDFRILYANGIGTDVGPPSPVPLPASAPMFGAALLVLGAAGLGLRRRTTAA